MLILNQKSDPAPLEYQPTKPAPVTEPSNRIPVTGSGGILSRGVSIKGSVKFLGELVIDGEVEGTVDSPGKLCISEHGQIKGDIRVESVKGKGNVDGAPL